MTTDFTMTGQGQGRVITPTSIVALKEDGRRRGEEGGAAIEGSLLGRVWGRNRAFGRLTVIV